MNRQQTNNNNYNDNNNAQKNTKQTIPLCARIDGHSLSQAIKNIILTRQ